MLLSETKCQLRRGVCLWVKKERERGGGGGGRWAVYLKPSRTESLNASRRSQLFDAVARLEVNVYRE